MEHELFLHIKDTSPNMLRYVGKALYWSRDLITISGMVDDSVLGYCGYTEV